MKDRFSNLKKLPDQPAVRLLAVANAKLKTRLNCPANASVSLVMEELDKTDAFVDMLRLMSVALPARERAWWACLAARDLVGTEVETPPRPLECAEAWVQKPSDETRDAARVAAEMADVDDDTSLCATCVIFCDGTLGIGDLAQYEAPPGAAQSAAFGMNIMALDTGSDVSATARLLIDRAVDIARGGNGKVARSEASETKETPQ